MNHPRHSLRIPDAIVASTARKDLPLWYAGELQTENGLDVKSKPRPLVAGKAPTPRPPKSVRSSNASPDALLAKLNY